MMGKVKICYKDGNSTKLLFGNITAEDLMFISLKAEDDTLFRINKSTIITIKELKVN